MEVRVVSEPEHEAFLKIVTDLPCHLFVGGRPHGRAEPGTPRRIGVDAGEVNLRAVSVEESEATWTETVTVEEGEELRVRVKMERTLSDLRKVQSKERTLRDPKSRLMWTAQDNGSDLTWQAADLYCRELEHGDWDDWRLPTLEELEGLEAMWSRQAFKTVDGLALTSCCPWSSERIDDTHAWNFNFRFRRPFQGNVDYSYDLRALCVRDGSDEIPEYTRANRKAAARAAKERKKAKALAAKEAKEAKAKQAETDEETDRDSRDDSPPAPLPSTR